MSETGQIIEILNRWVDAIRRPITANTTFADAALLNGGCISEDIERALAELTRLQQSKAALVEALKSCLATIDDYLAYKHDGDPWTEDSRAMGEMDINDFQRDGRLEKARNALANA